MCYELVILYVGEEMQDLALCMGLFVYILKVPWPCIELILNRQII
jgi:hypothetical protein